MLAPIISDGWKKLTNADAKEEEKRVKRFNEEFTSKLKLQRESHEQRLIEAEKAHELSLRLWEQKTYYERCWPLRNPFEMQICQPISDDKSYFDGNVIVPCRIISAFKDIDHPYARTINGNLSSFIVNYYPTNSIHAVVSEIGAWKDEAPTNDASINYLYAGLKKQPVMVVAPTLVNDGKTFIFKVWSWGLGEELNYPAGFEFGRLELKPLYYSTVYKETLKMVSLAKDLEQTPKFFSPKLQHNIAIIKEIQDNKISEESKERLLSFLTGAPEIDENVKAEMEKIVSGIFCCMAGMYADAYHLLEYKTLPKLPSILDRIPGVEYMIKPLKEYYYNLLNSLERIESDNDLLSRIYLDVAEAFGRIDQNQPDIDLYLNRSLRLFAKSEGLFDEHKIETVSINEIVDQIDGNQQLLSSEFINDYKTICEKCGRKVFENFD
jgi:hypothetical protein